MSEPMLIVFGILAGAVAVATLGRPWADIVSVLIVVMLLLSGVLTPHHSFAGFPALDWSPFKQAPLRLSVSQKG